MSPHPGCTGAAIMATPTGDPVRTIKPDVTASTVTAYALYTMSAETVGKFHTRLLPLTLPFVLYGIFRYLYLLYRRDLGGNPSDLLVNDRALLVDALLWMLATLAIIYGPRWTG